MRRFGRGASPTLDSHVVLHLVQPEALELLKLERVLAVEGGDIKTFDYSAEANPLRSAADGNEGGFTSEQKQALAAAMAGARSAAGQRRAGEGDRLGFG